ncbi:hypothetical protein E4U52_001004 [Claviceps spartinae]|nr:hypothetical protein E4U52_001004 [Claviceps spartinae]
MWRLDPLGSHLTPEGLAEFEEDMAFYEKDMASYEKSGGDPGFKQDCRDYENEQEAIHHMTELIQSTVAEQISTHLLPPRARFETVDGKP